MALQTSDYADGDEVLEAAVARPTFVGAAPAVLIFHQWAGRGENEHRTASRLAELGYVGIAADVFGKGKTGDPAGDNTGLIAPWLSDRRALRRRLLAAVGFARRLDGVDTRRIAAIGYCFGGLCALDLARTGTNEIAGVVSVHGMLDGDGLPAEGPIRAGLLVEHGWLDPLAPPEKLIAFADEMQARDADWQLHAHGRAMHAFTTQGADKPDRGIAYDAQADRRSWRAITAFLRESFGGEDRA